MTLKFSCNYRAFAGYLYVSECECGFTSSRFRMNIGWENVRSIQVDTKNIKEVPASVLLIKLRRNHTVSFLGEDSDVVMRDNSRKLCFYAFQDLLGAKEHLISLWKTYNVERKVHSSSSQKTYGYTDNTYQNTNNTYHDTRTPTNNAPTSFTTVDGNATYATNTASADAITALAPNTSYNIIKENAIISNNNNNNNNNNYTYSGNNVNPTENQKCYTNSLLSDKYIAPDMNVINAPANATSNERNYRTGTTESSNVNRSNTLSINTLASSTGTTNGGNYNNNDSVKLNVSNSSTQIFSPTRSQQATRETATFPKFSTSKQTKLMTTSSSKEWSEMTVSEAIWHILTLINNGPVIGVIMLLLLFTLLISSLSHIFSTAHSNELVNEDVNTFVDNILRKGVNTRHPLEHTTQLITQLQIAKTGCRYMHNNNIKNSGYDYSPDVLKTHNTVNDMFQWIKPDFIYSSRQQQKWYHSCKILYNSNDEWIDALQESTLELVRNYVALQIELDSLRGRRSKRLGNYHVHNNAQHNWRLQRIESEVDMRTNAVQSQEEKEQELQEHPESFPLFTSKKVETSEKDNRQFTTRYRESQLPHSVISLSAKDNSQPPALQIHMPSTTITTATTTKKVSFVRSLLQRYSRRQERQRRRGEKVIERTTHELSNFVHFIVHAFLPFLKHDRQSVLPFVEVVNNGNTNNIKLLYNNHEGENNKLRRGNTKSSHHNVEQSILFKSVNSKTNSFGYHCDNTSDADCNRLYHKEREEMYNKENEKSQLKCKKVFTNTTLPNDELCKTVVSNEKDKKCTCTHKFNNDRRKDKECEVVAECSSEIIHDEMHNYKERDARLEEEFSFLHIPFVDNEWHSLPETGSNQKNMEMVQYTEVISPHFRVVQDVEPDEALEREQCLRLSWRLVHVAELLDNIFNEFSNLFMRDVYSKLANGVERPSFWSRGPRSVTSMATEALTHNKHTPHPEERILHVLLLRRYANVLLYLNPLERREHNRRADALQFTRSLTEFTKVENEYKENNKHNTINSKKLQDEFNKLIAHHLGHASTLTHENERDILRNALPELSFWGRHGDLWVSHILKVIRLILEQPTEEKYYEQEMHEDELQYHTKCNGEDCAYSTNKCVDDGESLKYNRKHARKSNVSDELYFWKDLPVFRGLLCFTPQATLIDIDDNEHEASKEFNDKKTNRNAKFENKNNNGNDGNSTVLLQSANELMNKTKSQHHNYYDNLINLSLHNRSKLKPMQRTKNATLNKMIVKRHHNNITHDRTSIKQTQQQRGSLEFGEQPKAHVVSSVRVDYIPNHIVFQNDVKEIESLWVTEHKIFSLAITELTCAVNNTPHTAFKFNKEELHAHDELNFIHIRRRLINILQQVNRDYVNPLCTSKIKKFIYLVKYYLWPLSWFRSKSHRHVQPIERIAYNEMGMRDSASQTVAAEMMEIPWGGYNDAPLKILNNLLLQPPRLLALYFRIKTFIYTAIVFISIIAITIYFVLEFA